MNFSFKIGEDCDAHVAGLACLLAAHDLAARESEHEVVLDYDVGEGVIVRVSCRRTPHGFSAKARMLKNGLDRRSER